MVCFLQRGRKTSLRKIELTNNMSQPYRVFGSNVGTSRTEEADADDDNDSLNFDEDPEEHDSDEDTEEASETEKIQDEDGGGVELKEQIYRDKHAALHKQLQQLHEGTHPEYNRRLRKLETSYQERLRFNEVWRDIERENVERDQMKDKRAVAREFEEKKIDLRENLIAELEEKKKLIEAEHQCMELTSDSAEVKPVTTRKLRRRPNEPVPVVEKRRKQTPVLPNYLLDESEIEEDLRLLKQKPACVPKKPVSPGSPSPSTEMTTAPIARLEDGKLFYEKRWFHRGQPVYVEGKDVEKFSAVMCAIGLEAIWVRKTSDNTKFRIYLSQLNRGKFSIKRRAS